SNFVVHAYSLDDGEGGLLVNEIGAYSGVRPLTTPALVQITADGNWTVAPA
ncbi:TM2 domain-containing protein, partial [Micromonospora aurantiaca]|nr:TM2 domain-containing protein [Micromonospora aurantiaca]